jgi:hypothetical protein
VAVPIVLPSSGRWPGGEVSWPVVFLVDRRSRSCDTRSVPGAAIELVVAGAEAVTRRDPDAMVAVCASDIEFEMAGLDVYRGHAGMRECMDDLHSV